jgi:hypothetical protein
MIAPAIQLAPTPRQLPIVAVHWPSPIGSLACSTGSGVQHACGRSRHARQRTRRAPPRTHRDTPGRCRARRSAPRRDGGSSTRIPRPSLREHALVSPPRLLRLGDVLGESVPISDWRSTPVTFVVASLTSVIFPSALIVTSGSRLASINLRAYRDACFGRSHHAGRQTSPAPLRTDRDPYRRTELSCGPRPTPNAASTNRRSPAAAFATSVGRLASDTRCRCRRCVVSSCHFEPPDDAPRLSRTTSARVPPRSPQPTPNARHSAVDGVNIDMNSGRAARQTIAHAHVHVIPRRSGDVPDPRGWGSVGDPG